MPEFLEERLPIEIDYGSSFGEEYAVEITETANGNEYRRLRHRLPKMRYDLSYAMREQAWVMDEVVDLYHRCFGRFAGFRVKNLADYSSNGYTGVPTMLDQPMQRISDGVYQLQKEYGTNGTAASIGYPVRTIFKPVAGSVLVAAGGIAQTGLAINTTTGQVTWPANKTGTITGITKAASCVVTASNSLVNGESVVISGVVGMTQINGLRGVVSARTATQFTLNINTTAFSTYTSGGTFNTRPSVSEAVTAGFEFDVPCRFDSDISNLSLATFDTISANGIQIVEILNP